jgi:hypothetical protein
MKIQHLFIAGIGALLGFMIAFLFFCNNSNCTGTKSLSLIDSTSAQTYFDQYWAFSEPGKPRRLENIDRIFDKLDSTDSYHLNSYHTDVNGFFKDEYKLTNLTLDLDLLQQINEAYESLGKPKYLKLFMGDMKPNTPQFGFIAVGFDTTKVKLMGAVPPPELKRDGYTEDMYYLEGDESPTCPYHCDREWPIEKPPTH